MVILLLMVIYKVVIFSVLFGIQRWQGERSLDWACGPQCNDLIKQEKNLSVLKLYMYILVLLRRFGSHTKRLWITLQGFCHV